MVAVEVKAGGDPAGALERLGAAKSFEDDRNLNPRVKTVYVVRCITPELQRRISQNNPSITPSASPSCSLMTRRRKLSPI
ncbi:MAG: hypothetical protein MZV70_51770 [Desulfobacterales bacterium]|nr:hypothetical protein [Desulfobacterales bacterium]